MPNVWTRLPNLGLPGHAGAIAAWLPCLPLPRAGIIRRTPAPAGVPKKLATAGSSRDLIRSDLMTSQEQGLNTLIPDLRNIPVDRLAELGSSALAHSIALYRERLKENAVPLSSFQARI